MESDSESKLISLITELISYSDYSYKDWYSTMVAGRIYVMIQIISLVNTTDFFSQRKPESELMSLTKQAISVFNSMELDSQPKPLKKLVSLISERISSGENTDSVLHRRAKFQFGGLRMESEFKSLLGQTLRLEPEPELISLIYQVVSLVISMDPEWKKLISLCPSLRVTFEDGKIHLIEEAARCINISKWDCHPLNWRIFSLTKGSKSSHFICRGCNGYNHDEYDEAPFVIQHPLFQPEHHLLLVLLDEEYETRECYCCDDNLEVVFYFCGVCDFAINLACLQKPLELSIYHPKLHRHSLLLFPRQSTLHCSLCGLADLTSPIYMCPPCDFVVHLSCIYLPCLIKISRHLHRISFTPSFDQGNWSCHICRGKINNDCGGYSCIKEGCSYVAHSKCATQKNVWDGNELEGEPEEDIKEVKPFERIKDGIIRHFSHQQHYLKLDENTGKDYDDKKLCQACITPIYSGNCYLCMQCDFILHEECANLSQQIHYPIHPHMLTLVGGYDGVREYHDDKCGACPWICKSGFFYKCSKDCLSFLLHVQCATISEPLVHGSHMHPLFLTSKPYEERVCWVCKKPRYFCQFKETFNCIECDFALCFKCAIMPQKVRYKHDKHMLTLSYGKETSTMTSWCEICEGIIKPEKRFYTCDEYCCVTIHVKCLIGKDLYMKPGSSFFYFDQKVHVLHNYQHMSRPICSRCEKRCPYKIVFQWSGLMFCSTFCTFASIKAKVTE